MLISIIIPAFNEEKSMKHTVERIQYAINGNSHRGYSWELIVCDNNSTDKTADIATELGCRVGTANFQGTKFRSKYCYGHWLLFIDADTHPRPELLAETIDVIESGVYIGCGTTVEVCLSKGRIAIKSWRCSCQSEFEVPNKLHQIDNLPSRVR